MPNLKSTSTDEVVITTWTRDDGTPRTWTDAEIEAACAGAWARTQATLNAIHIDDPAAIGVTGGHDGNNKQD